MGGLEEEALRPQQKRGQRDCPTGARPRQPWSRPAPPRLCISDSAGKPLLIESSEERSGAFSYLNLKLIFKFGAHCIGRKESVSVGSVGAALPQSGPRDEGPAGTPGDSPGRWAAVAAPAGASASLPSGPMRQTWRGFGLEGN